MNQQNRVDIGRLWVGVAQMYNKEITKAALTIMLNAISDLPAAAVAKALQDWAGKNTLNRHPSPAELRNMVCPVPEAKALAIEAATRVTQAVSKFGWCDGTGARAFIGELGWRAVQRIGGWQYLCENLGAELQLTTVQAQIREQCLATLQLGEAGVLDEPPALPGKGDKLPQLTSVVKELAQAKDLNKKEDTGCDS